MLAAGASGLILVGLVLVRPIELRYFNESGHPMRRRDDSPEDVTKT